MHGAPADFLAETTGGAVRSAEGTDGHRRGRFCSRRVPVGGWGAAVSVVPGRGAGAVGFRTSASGGRVGRSGPAAAVAVSGVFSHSCVVAGVVVAAQGLFRGGDLGGAVGQGRRCGASGDRRAGWGAGVHGAGLVAGDRSAGRDGAELVYRRRGDRGVDVSIPAATGTGVGDVLAAVAAADAALVSRFGPGAVAGAVTAVGVAVACSGGRLLSPGWPAGPWSVGPTPVASDAGGCGGSSSRG